MYSVHLQGNMMSGKEEHLRSTENLKKQVIRKEALQYISKAIYQKGSPYNWTGKMNTFMKYWGKIRISQDLGKTDRIHRAT